MSIQESLVHCAIYGLTVTVWAGVSEDKSAFSTAMSIQGTLEQHKRHKECFRVVACNSTYTYFETDDVVSVDLISVDGSEAVIKIKV